MVKQKARYFLIEIIPNDESYSEIKTVTIFGSILKLIKTMHGDLGISAVKSSLMIKITDGNICCIKVETSGSHFLSTIIPFITFLGKTPCVLRTLFAGRSIRSCEKFLIKFRRNELYSLYSQVTSGVEKKKVLSAIASVTGKIE